MNNVMQEWKTLTGLTLGEAITRLAEILPPAAYKKVPGAADLTDIDPAYLTEIATRVFGPCGIGWMFHYDAVDLEVRWVERVKRSGEVYETYEAELKQLTMRYAYLDAENGMHWSEPIPANGGVDNENRAYAERGALTNAIGAAFAKLCWQILVYKGMVDHRNAAGLYQKQQKRLSGEGSQEGDRPPGTAAGESRPGGNGVSGNGAGGNGHQPADQSSQVSDASLADFVIPLGKNQGKKLGEVGAKWVKWYAHDLAASPKTQPLIEAARAFLERQPA